MSEEEIKKIAKEEFMNNVMEQLDSTLIFTYIQKLENKLQQKENIIKEVREYITDEQDKQSEFSNFYNAFIDDITISVEYILDILDKENK